MPGPLDMLKRGFSAATKPIVQTPYEDQIDAPRLDENYLDPNSMLGKAETFGRGMNAQIRGGLAGAAQGVRESFNPLSIGTSMLPFIGGAARGMMGAGRAAKAAGPTLDLVEPSVVKQVAPAMDDVDSLIGDMQRNLAKVPNRAQPAPHMETLGESAAEFTPMGGEGLYNAGRGAMNQNPDAMESLYQHLMRTMGGRGR